MMCIVLCMHAKNQTYFLMLFFSVCMVPLNDTSFQVNTWQKKRKDSMKSESVRIFDFPFDGNRRLIVSFMVVFIVWWKNRINFICRLENMHWKHDVVGPSSLNGAWFWGSIHFRKWQTINLFSMRSSLFYSSAHTHTHINYSNGQKWVRFWSQKRKHPRKADY